jgi:hypothetical protein
MTIIGIISDKGEYRLAVARTVIRDFMKAGKLVLPLLELPAVAGTDCRLSMTPENRAMTALMFQARKKGINVVWTAFKQSWVDKRFRTISDEFWLVEKGKGKNTLAVTIANNKSGEWYEAQYRVTKR